MPWKQSPSKIITPAAKTNARRLPRAMTDAKKVDFRRQVPIGPFIADFCCLRHRLIVELDGRIHETASAKSYDKSRDQALRAGGYRILRFSNAEAALDFRSVLVRIAAELAGATPTPNPSPQGGGESWSGQP